ncbi:leucine-rich repeat and WD repeat-containing protein 1 isoform X1 [Clarias magur]|uniref:Leucine-rich repeat and WD repeat-containing protein 1 n=1 Tax=Clarias magur TaxID=1594786 RepID=A0A8J4UHX9_CLAMG|nr:leucine-rich repeat and WD repeat-containing protein 1 isoform X1 [Clarias magur]
MAKITERILLEKGSPKENKLEKIKSINLSRMGLKTQDLPVTLLNKLSSLEELDLSGNMLQKLPAGLSLPHLRILNFSNNDMEEVTSLETLPGLGELRLDDNLYLTVSDEHKVMFLLHKLKILNGKDISATANHIRYVNSEILRKRVEMIAKEYFKSLTDPDQEDTGDITSETPVKECGTPSKRKMNDSKANSEDGTPRKRKTVDQAATPGSSPRKSSRLSCAASVEPSPKKSSRLPGTPQKSDTSASSPRCVKMNTPEASLRKSSRLQNTPKKSTTAPVAVTPTAKGAKKNLKDQLMTPNACGSTKKANETGTKHQVPKKAITSPSSVSMQEPASLQPLHVLQCHSKHDSDEDFSTQLWACAFESTHDKSSAWAQSVATCGGETVCVIDCESGHVLKKYKVPSEEFFTLAWTTVSMVREGGSARSCSILAAGGKRGMVKLIHPRANLAYGEFRASRRAISVLRFSPSQTSFLFSGAYDNKIIMWDIGGLDRDYNFKTSQLLVMESCSTPLHLCLPPLSPETHLISGCDDGLYSFDVQLSKNTQKRAEEMEIVFPVYKKRNKDSNYRTIDGLSFLTEDVVASKSHMQGSIYLWSWSGTMALRQGRKKEVSAVILAELQWTNTDIPYLSLNTCPGFGYVVCGDERGRLWTYHITDLAKANFKSGKAIPATEVLEWPSPVRRGTGPVEGPSINSVAMDPELRYLVALSDKNMVVVWKRASMP